jgi:hypothetical protein
MAAVRHCAPAPARRPAAASPRVAAVAGVFAGPLHAASAALVAGLVAAHLFLGETAVVGRMVAAFEEGGARAAPWASLPQWDAAFRNADADARVPRPELVAGLIALLRPAATKQYTVVVGESGTGKSTAVRDAMRSMPMPKGAVYFLTPELVASFSSELARAVGYASPFDPLASVFNELAGQPPPLARSMDGVVWRELRRALLEAAARFRTKHARPAVLVIDAVDYIAKKDPVLFGDLQDFAKVCADAGSLRVMFVSSEGAALPMMRASSAWSRALPPFEVQDIDDALAADYLIERGVARPAAEEAVSTIAGGRFALLLHVASSLPNKSIAAIRAELDVTTSAVLKTLGLKPADNFFRALLANGRVMSDVALDLLPAATLAALLRANVLAMHPDGAYTTHARHVETFLRHAGR